MRDALWLELSLQSRSRWTLIAALAMIAIVIVGAVVTGESVQGMATSLKSVQEAQGADFDSWLLTSPDAAVTRAELSGVRPERAANLATSIFGAVGPMILGVWGASVAGIEFGHRTVRSRAAHVGWSRAVIAKVIVIFVGVIVVGAAAILSGVIAGNAVFVSFAKSSPALADVALAETTPPLAPGFVAASAGVAFYGLLACLIAVVTGSLSSGIIGGLAVPYLESFVGVWWLPQSALASMLNQTLIYFPGAFVNAPPVKSPPPAPWVAWLVLAVWGVAVLGALVFTSSRQEID